jgi:hypothetical protein
VNLSAFETTFQEKRPVLRRELVGVLVRRVQLLLLQQRLESQRVLLATHRSRTAARRVWCGRRRAYADVPDASTILGAAKVTGRTSNGLSVAMLEALTNRVTARYVTGTARGADAHA